MYTSRLWRDGDDAVQTSSAIPPVLQCCHAGRPLLRLGGPGFRESPLPSTPIQSQGCNGARSALVRCQRAGARHRNQRSLDHNDPAFEIYFLLAHLVPPSAPTNRRDNDHEANDNTKAPAPAKAGKIQYQSKAIVKPVTRIAINQANKETIPPVMRHTFRARTSKRPLGSARIESFSNRCVMTACMEHFHDPFFPNNPPHMIQRSPLSHKRFPGLPPFNVNSGRDIPAAEKSRLDFFKPFSGSFETVVPISVSIARKGEGTRMQSTVPL